LALSPPTTAGVVLVWVLVVLISGYASLGSMLGLASSGLFLYLTGAPPQFVALGVVLAAVAAWQHRANIKRLLEGKELKFNQKVAPKGSTP
jgi:glycerol-3-phosphate acyltransferase PlsY